VCRREVEQHHLPMDVVDAEWQLDHGKLTFFYTSRQ
jgi:cell fate regulator YaaT (PSP1 superfamily)